MPSRCASGASTSSVSRALLGLLLRRQEAHGAHVVQPVGQLDHQHPRVAGHRDDHLADGLGLGGVAELDLVQLGHAVDQVRDLLAELGAQLVQRVVGVLDGVVQQRGDQRGGVHAQLGQDRRHGQRVGDVRVAGLALLALRAWPRPPRRPAAAAPGRPSGAACGARAASGSSTGGTAATRCGRHPAGDPGAHPAGGRRPRRDRLGRDLGPGSARPAAGPSRVRRGRRDAPRAACGLSAPPHGG